MYTSNRPFRPVKAGSPRSRWRTRGPADHMPRSRASQQTTAITVQANECNHGSLIVAFLRLNPGALTVEAVGTLPAAAHPPSNNNSSRLAMVFSSAAIRASQTFFSSVHRPTAARASSRRCKGKGDQCARHKNWAVLTRARLTKIMFAAGPLILENTGKCRIRFVLKLPRLRLETPPRRTHTLPGLPPLRCLGPTA